MSETIAMVKVKLDYPGGQSTIAYPVPKNKVGAFVSKAHELLMKLMVEISEPPRRGNNADV